MPRHFILVVASASILLGAGAAQAACYADYKAKRDNPLRLHYGVIQLSDGNCAGVGNVSRQIANRIGSDGWELLTVVSTFGEDGLEERRQSAGANFLRY